MVCQECGTDLNLPAKSEAKFCKPCRIERQSAALREGRPPSKKRGRTYFEKVCPWCKSVFQAHSGNRCKVFCTTECSVKATHDFRKIKISREDLLEAINTTDTYISACEKLKVSPWTFYRRMKEVGLKREKKAYKPRDDGYWNYTIPQNHRRIMERHLGRKLLSREHVHHVNGDKNNNDPLTNLVVVHGTREHALVHASLQECAYKLFELGLIGFDHAEKRYFLTPRGLP